MKQVMSYGAIVLLLFSSVLEAQQDSTDIVSTDNLILNPDFQRLSSDKVPTHWVAKQHAGEQAYRVSYTDGVLTIDKQGEQHWFTLTQSLDVEALAGQPLCFEADVKMSMYIADPPNRLKEGAGLFVNVMSKGTSSRNYLVKTKPSRVVFSSVLKNQPILGKHDWMKTGVAFTVPDDAKQMTLGFMHSADGEIAFRRPQLLMSESCDGANASMSFLETGTLTR